MTCKQVKTDYEILKELDDIKDVLLFFKINDVMIIVVKDNFVNPREDQYEIKILEDQSKATQYVF